MHHLVVLTSNIEVRFPVYEHSTIGKDGTVFVDVLFQYTCRRDMECSFVLEVVET